MKNHLEFMQRNFLKLAILAFLFGIFLGWLSCSPSHEEQKKAHLDSLSKQLDLNIKNAKEKLTQDTNELNRQIKRREAGVR